MKSTILAVVASMTLTSTAIAGGLTEEAPVTISAQVAPAPILSGTIGFDLTENASGNIVADSVVELGVTAPLGFASVDVIEENGTAKLDGYSMGTTIAGVDVSIGKQGDVLGSFGGVTEVVGGATLANPASDHETIQIGTRGVLASVGFTDVTKDVSDIENVQVAYGMMLNGVAVVSGLDYNFNSEDVTLLTNATTTVQGVPVGLTATYADHFAYELDASMFGVTGFVNGDEDDMLQNIGAGYYGTITGSGFDFYAEAGYNLDAEEITPAAGISFSF
jgi:hypothetical protein